MRMDIEQDLEHSRAAYIFSLNSLPDPRCLKTGRIDANGFAFTKPSEIQSMVIELGWAFFCRYEACLEAYIKEQGVTLSKKKTLENWMDEKGVSIPDEYRAGIRQYRKVRNWLHHRDGQNDDGTEIHLLQEQMDQFYHLILWIASAVAAKNKKESGS